MVLRDTGTRFLFLRRPTRESPCPKVVDKQIPATGQRKPCLPCLGAKDICVEQTQVRPLIERSHLDEDFFLEGQAKAAQSFGFQPLAAVLFAKVAGKGFHHLDVNNYSQKTVQGRQYVNPDQCLIYCWQKILSTLPPLSLIHI